MSNSYSIAFSYSSQRFCGILVFSLSHCELISSLSVFVGLSETDGSLISSLIIVIGSHSSKIFVFSNAIEICSFVDLLPLKEYLYILIREDICNGYHLRE